MPAIRAMNMAAALRNAIGGISLADFNPALVEMISMQPVKAPVVQIVGVTVVLNRGMAAPCTVNMGMVAVNAVICHHILRLADVAILAQAARPR